MSKKDAEKLLVFHKSMPEMVIGLNLEIQLSGFTVFIRLLQLHIKLI